jgi:hypothetical protein
MTLRKERILEIERVNITLHSVENALWKRPWTCRKTDYRMNEWSAETPDVLSPGYDPGTYVIGDCV